MADLIKQLYKKNDSTTKIFPNIKAENIPSSSVSLVKLTSDIQTKLNNISNKLDSSKLDSLLLSIKTNLASYGVDFTYSYSNDAWTISFANIEQTFEYEVIQDITINKAFLQRNGNHFVGILQLTANDQIGMGVNLVMLLEQTFIPNDDFKMNAFVGSQQKIANINSDGYISINTGLAEYDVLTIRLDWWV